MLAPQQETQTKCAWMYSECESAIRIKRILCKYTEFNHQNNPIVFTDSYCLLLNDFHHIKSNHNTNDDPHKFNAFYDYLCDKANASQCDIGDCHAAKIHYARRCRSYFLYEDHANDMYSKTHDLVCRIHVYFMHSSDRLTSDEIKWIEQQLNEYKGENDDDIHDKKLELLSIVMHRKKQSTIKTTNATSNFAKFTTAEHVHHAINCTKLSTIFADNLISIDEKQLENTFDNYEYDDEQLIDDICSALIHKNEDKTLLCQILINEFRYEDELQRQMMYGRICHEYLMMHNEYFVKILQVIASTLKPSPDPDEIATIGRSAKLNGNIFVKGHAEFKTSVKVAQIFKKITNYKKKQWTQMYTSMDKWKMTSAAVKPTKEVEYEEKKYEEDIKHHVDAEEEMDYIQQGTDEHIIQQFCTVTTATKNVAMQCLDGAAWDLSYAAQNYYSQLNTKNYDNISSENAISPDGRVYNDGVAFWYWSAKRSNKRFVQKREQNLKEEILKFSQFTMHHWDRLVDKCYGLLKTKKVKEMSSNGINVNIYHQQRGMVISCEHLCSIQLYTDYTGLCYIFCAAFRRKKLTQTQYERIESVQRRNEKIANWAKLLTESVQCYGTFMTPESKYYRGIDMQYVFKRFITRFNVPLSTSTNFMKAMECAGEDAARGLVIELEIFNEYIPGLDCSSLSSFDMEKEVLFFGSDSIFQICTVWQFCEPKWTSFRKYIKQIQRVMDIANGSIHWDRVNNIKQIVGHMLPHLYPGSKPLPPYIESLLNYRLNHLPNTIEYDFRDLKCSFQWVKRIFMNKEEWPNISNACNLFKHCNRIRMQMGMDDTINMNNAVYFIEEMVGISNPNVAIEFQWTSPKDLHQFDFVLQQCAKKSKTVSLQIETTSDDTMNSITIKPSIHIVHVDSDRASEISDEVQHLIELPEGHGIIFQFIHIFARIRDIEFYTLVPHVLAMLIYRYIGVNGAAPTQPVTIEELIHQLWLFEVSDEDLEVLQEHFDEEMFDMPGIIEDVSDLDEAMLIDFCREVLNGGERVFNLIKALVEGTTANLSPTELRNVPICFGKIYRGMKAAVNKKRFDHTFAGKLSNIFGKKEMQYNITASNNFTMA
eukprot:734097_1